MKAYHKKTASLFLLIILAIAASSFAFTSVFAKNMNIPGNAKIEYWTGGIGIVETPTDWPNRGLHQSILRFYGFEVEAGTLGPTDVLILAVPSPLGWVAIACFATNPDVTPFLKSVRSGMPAAIGPLNTKTVSEDTLRVERHGNQIHVELATAQTIYWANATGTGIITISLPAFTMNLDEIDGSIHKDHVDSFTGYKAASNYTVSVDEMGFNANGSFTCPAWSYLNHVMNTCFITMHGISIYIPPS